jgi:succinoglycan biosynthesis transport protein ExoP
MNMPPAGMQPGQAPAQQTTLREFLAVVFRRRWLILGLFFVVTATVLVLTLSTPTVYSSSGRVLVTRGERESALTGRVQILNDWEQDLSGEVAKVRSTMVLGRAKQLLEERAKRTRRVPLAIVPARVDVQVMGKSNVLGIGYDDLNPEVAQEVCDALLNAYVAYRQQRPIGQTDSLFALQLEGLRKQLELKTSLRESMAMSTGVNDPLEQGRAWNSRLATLELRYNEAAADLAEQRSKVETMSELQKHPELDLPMIDAQYSTNESALYMLKQKSTDQQARVATLRERYRDDSPEVVNALETLESLQALLRKEVDQRMALSASRIAPLQARLAVYAHDLEELRARLAAMPRNEKTLDGLDAEIKTLRARNEEYTKARDQARITANVSQGVTIVLLNGAGPASPKNTRDIVRLLLAPGFSLVVGIGLAFFIDGLDLTVRTAGQAEAYLDLPVLATLPERRGRRG